MDALDILYGRSPPRHPLYEPVAKGTVEYDSIITATLGARPDDRFAFLHVPDAKEILLR